MSSLFKRIVNRLVNTSRSLRWTWKNKKDKLLLGHLNLEHTFQTGIQTQISSFADWSLYNDIFIEEEYDLPIRNTFQNSGDKVQILDLGANIGFFMKRMLHIRRVDFPDIELEIICIEGAPQTFSELERQLPTLMEKESVSLMHGLAGKKTGSATLQINPFHAMTTLSLKDKKHGVSVNFIDLSEVTSKWGQIDLLKCDIEGAEQLLIENHQDLLNKTKRMAIEFHLDRVDREHCLNIACNCGLKSRDILHENEHISVELLSR